MPNITNSLRDGGLGDLLDFVTHHDLSHTHRFDMEGGLIGLPAELKLIVFESLPATEIQRARLTCRDIRAFVDINTSAMARDIGKREYMRLQSEIHDVVGYKDEGIGLIRALRR